MEYDKHIKRLVLGYLKSECKAAYKIFFKSHFQNESRHVATRVAGQTLEDILKVYSRVQDIVQGRLEDTEYYKEYGTEVSSPTYLVEQLLYLLERDRVLTPTSTIRDRSPEPTSANEIYQNEADCANITDIETTPEYTLPGNVVNETENFKSTTPYRRYSPVFRTPYLQQLPSTEQQNISSTVSKKLLRNRELPMKLARNINTAYLSRQKELADSKPSGIEYEERVIKSVIDKTEADPMFEELLDDLLGAVGSTLEKAMGPGMAVSSSSTRTESPSSFKHTQTQLESEPIETTANQQTEISETQATIEHQELSKSTSNNEQCQDQNEKQSVIIQSEVVIQPPLEDRVTMSTSSQCSMQPPQLIIVNQPLVMPQPLSVLQSVSSILQPNGKGSQFCGMLTAQDILQAPVVLNEISADGSSMTPGNTPFKLGDVKDIREYLSIFTVNTPQKNKSRNKRNNLMSLLKPTPTIKVEIFNSLLPMEIPKNEFPHASNHSSQLPDLSDFVADDAITNPTRKDSIADVPEAKKSTPNENKIPPQETTKPKSLGSIHTPSPVVNSIPKPTNKSSSHVRNLTFPSPIRKTNEKNEPTSLTITNKQQASKDLFKEPDEAANNTVEEMLQKKSESKPRKVSKKSPRKIEKSQKQVTKSTTLKKNSSLWDAELRKLATTGEPEEPVTMSKKTKRRLQREAELLEVDAKKLEDALKTPGKPEPLPKQKTLKEKAAKVKTERVSSQVEVEKEGKKVMSPSKIYNTANKRNMDIDGITPKNAKDGSTQLVSHARKNITGLLVTPLKDEEDSPNQNITKEASADTPFTPMLKANLQGFAVGDNFTIDTPNFPITPGMSLMEHPTPAYCILNDTETNKATEAIVLSEERKSSVRKTDDEDVIVVSPKVYGTTEILEEFNKSRAGKKNLELLGNKAVSWDSDVEENNSSTSNEEPNGTVIQNVKKDETGSMRITRSSGKSLSMLKSQMLNSSVCFDESTNEVKQEVSEVKATSPLKSEAKPTASIEKGTSSGDSEITSKDTYKKRISSELVSPNVQSPVVKKKPTKTTKEKRKKELKSKKKLSNEVLSGGEAEVLNDTIKNTESTPKVIKDVFLSATLKKTSSHLIKEFSVKAEIDEKRKRVIELDKFMSAQSAKTPSRRRSSKLLPRSCLSGQTSSKRKKSSPRRLVKRVAKKKTTSEESDSDSQDEFFKQSGSNLHRTNKQSRSSERLKARNSRLESKEDAGKEMEKEVNESDIEASKDENSKKSENLTIAEENSTLWDDCVIELQSEEISVVHDEKTTSKKSFKDYDLTVLTKAIQLDVPLADGTEQTVQIGATPFKILWHFPPVANIKNVSGSNVKNDDCPAMNDCMRSLIESNSDSEHGTKLSDTNDHKISKKRKHRSDSCSSSSSKKLKIHLHPKFEDSHIKNVLTMLHGPSEKS